MAKEFIKKLPCDPFLGTYSKELNTCTQKPAHRRSQKDNSQQPKDENNPNVHKEMDGKIKCVLSIRNYAVIKVNEALAHGTTEMKLEISERNQT